MQSETNTQNRFLSFLSILVEKFNSDSGELVVGGENTDETEAGEAENQETETTNDESENGEEKTVVDLEDEAVKNAITAKVEEIVGGRVSREKQKTTAAEERAEAAEKKLQEEQAELEKLREDLLNLKNEVKTSQFEAMTFKLSAEEGVSHEVVKNLKGDTEEQLRAAIKLITDSSKSKQSVDRIFSGKDGSTGKVVNTKDLALLAAKAARVNR